MLSSAFLLLAAILAPQSVPAPPPTPSVPVLDISLHSIRADGRSTGRAGNSGAEPFAGYASTTDTFCGMAAFSTEPVDLTGTIWKFSGEILGRDGDQFVVRISWARLWQQGRRAGTEPGGSTQVTLQMGERLVLDSIDAPTPNACDVVAARLEAVMTTRAPWQLRSGSGGGAQSVGAGGARAGGSGGGGRGGGSAAGSGARATGGGGRNVVPLITPAGPPVDAELWFVHRRPDGTEDSQHLAVHATPAGAPFEFPSVPLATSRGRFLIGITGRLQSIIVSGHPSRIIVTITRKIGVEGAPQLDSSGNSYSNLAIPAPGEVIAFEMPPAPGADALEGHQFSVRMRVGGVK
jgi:hypothetical protein